MCSHQYHYCRTHDTRRSIGFDSNGVLTKDTLTRSVPSRRVQVDCRFFKYFFFFKKPVIFFYTKRGTLTNVCLS